MTKTIFTKILIATFMVFGLSGLYMLQVRADSKITITADKATASVSVTISDPSLDGKEISVVCYNPKGDGVFSDWNKNQGYIVYLNQYKGNVTTRFNFKIKEQPVTGEYFLVIGSGNGKVIKKFRFYPVEIKKLSTPKSLKAVQAGATNVSLTWGKVEGAKSYDIYRSKKASSGFTKIGSASAASYQDKKASAGSTWYYKVSAIGSTPAANSNLSSAVKVLVLSAPSAKVKSTAKRTARVTWKKVNGANGYQVFVATKKSGKYKNGLTLKGASKKSGIIKKLKSGRTYYIRVRAYKIVGGKRVLGKFSNINTVKIR